MNTDTQTTNRTRMTGAPQADAVLFGIAAAIVVDIALWALTIMVELFGAGESASPLPPPGNAWIIGARMLIAITAGALITRRRIRQDLPPKEGRLFGVIVLVGVFILGATAFAHGLSGEHKYLDAVPPGVASSEALLAAGHEACEWLGDQNWGGPPSGSKQGLAGNDWSLTGERSYGGRTGPIVSTAAYYVRYLDHLGGRSSLEAQVTLLAWYDLCPFQQWVHRPVGGSSGD